MQQSVAQQLKSSVNWNRFFLMVNAVGDQLNDRTLRFLKSIVQDSAIARMSGGTIEYVDQVGQDHQMGSVRIETKCGTNVLTTGRGKAKRAGVTGSVKLNNTLGSSDGRSLPDTFDYLMIVDESHVTIPQLGAMYKGDASRKKTLSDYGFRLPSCLDNRPLKFQEWELFRPQTIYVSATPGNWELEKTQGVFTEQLIRPTGLIDPETIVRGTKNQVDDIIAECRVVTEQNQRVLITTLTKKMAESLTEFMNEAGLKVRYLHSDIDTLERIEIIRDLRLGVFDILIGINLLREGLDIPECGLVAILDADKEGFLRSKTSLVQTIGRAARNVNGRVILYADIITGSLDYALNETKRRREKQEKYNLENNIKPESIIKNISNIIEFNESNNTNDKLVSNIKNKSSPEEMIKDLEIKMKDAAANLEFEEAAKLRDTIRKLEHKHLGLKLK